VTAVSPRLDLTSAIEKFRAVSQEASQSGASNAELAAKLADDGRYLATVRRDIQRNVRRPMTPEDLSAIQIFLEEIIGVISHEVVSSTLQSPVSPSSLTDSGYELLDTISEYSLVATHFYAQSASRSRQRRPANEVRVEVEAVSDMSSEVKTAILDYIEKVRRSLTGSVG
jgi:hypothetical protein